MITRRKFFSKTPGKYDYIDMGGMFTIVKVRENLTSYEDPGWYETPPGTSAILASNDELERDLGHIPEAKPSEACISWTSVAISSAAGSARASGAPWPAHCAP